MRKGIVVLLAVVTVFFSNCKKEIPTVQTTTKTDTVFVKVHDTLTVSVPVSDTTTTLILLRHAEKESTGADPNINSDGVERAEELRRMLDNVPVKGIYSTSFNRTRQTVQPLANAKGIAVTEYAASTPYAQLVSEIRNAHRGKVVVIVGHSDTVPGILRELSNNSFNISISDSQYDNLYIVSLPNNLSATIMPLKYGKVTP